MAAAPPTTASALYGNPAFWVDHAFDHAATMTAYGPAAAGTNNAAINNAFIRMGQNSPLVFVFALEGDDENIYVGHSLTLYPDQPGSATPLDGHNILLVGNDLRDCTAVCLPVGMHGRRANINAYSVAYIQGADGHTRAAPAGPRYRFAHVNAGTGDTDQLTVRCAALVHPALLELILEEQPTGQYTYLAFNNFLRDRVAAGGDEAAAAGPLVEWYRVACMSVAGDDDASPVMVAAARPTNVRQDRALEAARERIKNLQLTRLGYGGAALSSAAFQAGVARLTTTLEDSTQRQLEYQRQQNNKTFTDKYGAHIAQIMYNLTGAADDDHLPPIHRTLAKAHKGQFYAILQAAFQARALASPVPLIEGNLPLVTTKFADEVFRSFQPAHAGLEFAKGLTPFAMVCQGHKEAYQVASMQKRAEMAERGNSLGLDDAATLVATDVRFPTSAQIAAEKLYAFSVAVDLFHGEATEIAMYVRMAVLSIAPALASVQANAASKTVGIDLVCRILYDLQQDYFLYVSNLSRFDPAGPPALRPTCPHFRSCIDAVRTFRASSLAVLPAPWYSMIEHEAPKRESSESSGSRGSSGNDSRARANVNPVVNPNADTDLLRRFRDSEHSNITSMIGDTGAKAPKHAGKDVCLTWALKGECTSGCKRAANHVRYSQATNKPIGSNGFG